ncbi:legume-like lectin family-domain-containing protein, partial [Vararia minispora EC-137]
DGTRIANRTIERTAQLRTHSLYAPYIDQDLQNRWWDFGADAYVNTNKHIRLTQNKPSQMGWLWSRLPLTAHSWVLEVEFKIGDKSTHLYGDGMAVWITKDRAQPGPIFGSKDRFEGLGIFLDTYANGRHPFAFPRIVGMLGDGQTKYDHDTDGEQNKIGACSANYRRTTVPTKLRVSYVKDVHLDAADNARPQVKLQYKGWDEWTDCFSYDNLKLPVHPYVGFSALTGDVSDPHDIISVTLSSVVLSSPESQRNSLKSKGSILGLGSSSGGGSGLSFWIKFLLFFGVCAGGWYGWNTYGRSRLSGPGGFSGLG